MDDPLGFTPAQARVLEIVDKRGAAFVGAQNQMSTNTVHAGAARALVRAGWLEEFMGPDGQFVQRTGKENGR